jgi:hypothetical protein
MQQLSLSPTSLNARAKRGKPVGRWLRMELAQDRKARRLAIDRRRLWLREIARRQANKAAPFSLSLCELLEKIEIMPTGRGDGVPS